jgi:D-alanine-D-alanine ligase-like ATP-grasp enzyme
MESVYTTTITNAAQKRDIKVRVLDPHHPIFELIYKNKSVRCYNALTDNVGAATFHLAQNKFAANHFLKQHGFPVAHQVVYSTMEAAFDFLSDHVSIVVKPADNWGGRGVSTHIESKEELKEALEFAKKYSDEIVLEKCVSGIDWRLIFVNFTYTCAIQRNPASVTGNGIATIRELILEKNKLTKRIDPSNCIPLDNETARALNSIGCTFDSILECNKQTQVRRTTNYHTGGTVEIVTDKIPSAYISVCENVTRLLKIPVLGIDLMVDQKNDVFHIIELSPDLAISPPEGDIVAEAWLDYLFPDSKVNI